MSNRKNKIGYKIIGKSYYNEPHITWGEIEYDRLVIAKPLLLEIESLGIWGKYIKFAGLYSFEFLNNETIMSVLYEMNINDFILIDKIEFFKNTKIIHIKDL